MTGPEEKIGAKKEAAILALLTARGIEEAAKTANVPAAEGAGLRRCVPEGQAHGIRAIGRLH